MTHKQQPRRIKLNFASEKRDEARKSLLNQIFSAQHPKLTQFSSVSVKKKTFDIMKDGMTSKFLYKSFRRFWFILTYENENRTK